jgi:hypothetical protein
MTLKTMHDSGPFRIKSPQLYQLSYRPKCRRFYGNSTSEESAGVGFVPRVCPGLDRREAST